MLFRSRDNKLGRAVRLNGNPELFGKGGQGLLGVVLVWIEQVDLFDFMFLDPAPENLGVAVGGRALGEATVKNTIAGFF